MRVEELTRLFCNLHLKNMAGDSFAERLGLNYFGLADFWKEAGIPFLSCVQLFNHTVLSLTKLGHLFIEALLKFVKLMRRLRIVTQFRMRCFAQSLL